jgi:hypothetical protein
MKLYCFAVMNGFLNPPVMYLIGKKNLVKEEKKRIKSFKKQLKRKKNE